MANDLKQVTMLMLQYSVVVKGIEKKLNDMSCNVTMVSEELENRIERLATQTDLFLFYLPGDLYDDQVKRIKMQHLIELLSMKKKPVILLGEAKYHDEMRSDIPKINEFAWLNRPIDMKALENSVEALLNGEMPEEKKKKRILIVDDDPSYAKMIREWIRDKYQVDIVTGGMQAISFLLKVPDDEPVKLVLLDYEMPVVDGPQVLQMLRQEEKTAHIPVIFLTGIGSKEAVMRVMSLKPEGYLLKSTNRSDILKFLQEKLG